MSMADQYDDGRYDPGLSGRDIYPPTPYGIPMVADEHGFATPPSATFPLPPVAAASSTPHLPSRKKLPWPRHSNSNSLT
jgi:hypothetical protein